MKRILRDWFTARGWKPFAFQREVWRHMGNGEDGLVHAPTGMGKTYAAWFGALGGPPPGNELRVLWITPLRALANDTAQSLAKPVDELGLPWRVESRTGDTPAAVRDRQMRLRPNALVTTPESLTLMLSSESAERTFGGLGLVVLDEWHEQMGTKRGVQTELALARLRGWNPGLVTWGLSATIGNLDEALRVMAGSREPGVLVRGIEPKRIEVDALLPPEGRGLPWAGHMGAPQLPQVVDEIRRANCTLVFTNTRSQAERWYQMILESEPEWAGAMALHHGSLSRESRDWVEASLRGGQLKCVVCTSSLDLGVDFAAVDRVLQVGSPKGVSRLLQRAGRSGHQPGSASHATCVPAHAFELVEACAAREAVKAGKLEARVPLSRPLDVLAQHMVTIACAGGFRTDELFEEVRSTHSYRELTRAEWDWTLKFVAHGGASLAAYPDFHKLAQDEEGRWRIASTAVARRHRMNIGTITSDSSMRVQYLTGGTLGHIEERFISGLAEGQAFIFGGKMVELVRVRNMTAFVRVAQGVEGVVPKWMGSRMPLSSLLCDEVRRKLDEAARGSYVGPEMEAARGVLERQRALSWIPRGDELLVERLIRNGRFHLFVYPFEGRLVHEGLAPLLAYRLSRVRPISISTVCTDYAIELVSPDPLPELSLALFSTANLREDLAASVNAAELGRRQFREIARVAGLTFQGFPGQGKTAKQLQASASLLFDVLTAHDPGNLLLAQAHREVLEQHLEAARMEAALERIGRGRVVQTDLRVGSPLCFPLLVDKIQASTVSTETVLSRILKLQQRLEKAA